MYWFLKTEPDTSLPMPYSGSPPLIILKSDHSITEPWNSLILTSVIIWLIIDYFKSVMLACFSKGFKSWVFFSLLLIVSGEVHHRRKRSCLWWNYQFLIMFSFFLCISSIIWKVITLKSVMEPVQPCLMPRVMLVSLFSSPDLMVLLSWLYMFAIGVITLGCTS